MILNVGDNVRISLDPNEQIHSIQGVWNYQGRETRVSRRKVVSCKDGKARGIYYELEKVVSDAGLPFAFLEEQLVPID